MPAAAFDMLSLIRRFLFFSSALAAAAAFVAMPFRCRYAAYALFMLLMLLLSLLLSTMPLAAVAVDNVTP